MRDFDEMLEEIGGFGRFQIGVYLINIFLVILCVCHVLANVFLAAVPDHWCKVAELESLNVSLAARLAATVPWEDREGLPRHSRCWMYDRDYSNATVEDVYRWQNASETPPLRPCLDWEYDTSTYSSSVTTQWNLVCGNQWMHATSSSAFMAGMMVGCLVTGALSDRFGRRKVLLVTILGVVVTSISCAFSPNFAIYAILRFFLGVFERGVLNTSFVALQEMVGPTWRVAASIGGGYAWTIGYMILAGLAYFIRDWFPLQLAISLPWLLCLSFFCILPESPRWLLSQGRKEEALTIMERMARVNRNSFSPGSQQELAASSELKKPEGEKVTVLDLLRTPNMRKKSLTMFLNWFVNALVYFGLSLNTSNLGGNDYINALLFAAVEMPSHAFLQLIVHYVGRRWLLCTTEVVAGLALLSILAVPPGMNWLVITLAMIGKFNISASFCTIYFYSAELFPTGVRNVGVGASSSCARVGGIVAPYINLLSGLSSVAPTVVFGGFALAAGLSALLLPETKGQKLPQTIADGEQFGKKVRSQTPKEQYGKFELLNKAEDERMLNGAGENAGDKK